MNERLTLQDTPMTAVMKLAESNPGAVTVCVELFKQGPAIDPDAALGGISKLMSLDTHGIYGHRIWMLYSDVCRRSISDTMAVLRAVQLGLRTEFDLNLAIDNRGASWDLAAVMSAVQDVLPDFNKAQVAA